MQGEYKGDFTRDSFDPRKHFLRVLMQQGRVSLDADANEQVAILLHYLQALAADLIGPYGGTKTAFALSPLETEKGVKVKRDFRIDGGRYYVDGIACELDSAAVRIEPATDGHGQVVDNQVHIIEMAEHLSFWNSQYLMLFDEDADTTKITSIVVQLNGKLTGGKLTFAQSIKEFMAKATRPCARAIVTYLTQPDYPISKDPPLDTATTLGGASHLVYLDVWERHITYAQDDSIREVALGGPDTTTRTKVVWQVKTTDTGPYEKQAVVPAKLDVKEVLRDRIDKDWSSLWVPQWQPENRGRLKAIASRTPDAIEPCIVSPDARYGGADNQLYRVEVHRGGVITPDKDKPNPTFKWSRENACVVFPILSAPTPNGGGTTLVTVGHLGRDDRLGLAEGDWVEFVDDDSILHPPDPPSALFCVHAIDQNVMTVTLKGTHTPTFTKRKHPLLRRWDHKAGDQDEGGLTLDDDDHAAQIFEGSGHDEYWLALENGLRIQFQASSKPDSPHRYRSGDYWLIPARTATGDIEWPIELDSRGKPVREQGDVMPIALPPHGVDHHYAPLAIVTVGDQVTIVNDGDCRFTFKELRERP